MKFSLNSLYKLNAVTLSIYLVVVLIVVYLIGFDYLQVMELTARDLRFQIRGQIEHGHEVVLAVVDEKSLDELGRWPWPRSLIADVIRKLDSEGAAAMGFDIGFLEKDHNTNMKLIQKLESEVKRRGVLSDDISKFFERERALADNDLILANAIKEAKMPVVLGYFLRMERDSSVAHVTPEMVTEQVENLKNAHYTFVRFLAGDPDLEIPSLAQAFMPVSNIPQLVEVAESSGYMNMFQDIDGTVRWIPMVIQLRDKLYLPLSLQTLRQALGRQNNGIVPPASIFVTEVGVEKIIIGDLELPTDERGRFLINYRGPSHTFPHISMADILAGRFKPGTFKDKIVLAGATAIGIYDMRVVPFETGYPGLEVHANTIDNILRQDFLIRPNWAAIFDILFMILAALTLGIVLPKMSAFVGPIFGLALLAAETGVNFMFFRAGIWLDLVFPIMTVILVYTGITVFRYMTEEREKKKIKGAFQTYVNPSVVNEMLKNPDMLQLGGDKMELSVLFSDIVGFTTISEGLDPEALVHLLNRYLTSMTDIVFKYNGTLDKYIGDAIMAVYGAPLPDPEHALNACRTALQMLQDLATLREELAAEDPNVPYIDIRIGVNTGEMVAGNMGSESRFDYTVMGDEVNLGARLESGSKQYGTKLLIGENTHAQVKDVMFCRELDLVAVKGKTLPVRIFELLGENGDAPDEQRRMVDMFIKALDAYKAQKWDKAEASLNDLLKEFPDDGPSKVFLGRVADLRNDPPPADWDGVFVMTSK